MQARETTRLDAEIAELVQRTAEEYFRRMLESTTTTDEATERVTEIFDTTQPTDSTTGTPPLLSRITEKSESRSRSASREQTEATARDSTVAGTHSAVTLTDETDIASEAQSQEATENESREERSGPWWLTALKLIGFLAAAGFLLWLTSTVVKAIKQFSNNH